MIDTPLSQVILPVMRACFFGGAAYAVLLAQRGHGNQVVSDIAGFLTGDDGLLEIKAPLPHTQVEYWISGEVGERFRPQLQGQLYVSQRAWVDIACWHDELPKLVMRVEPNEEFIKALDRELRIFNYFIERVIEKIHATYGMPAPKGGLALKAALLASLETGR